MRRWTVLALLALTWALLLQGSRGLWEPDEGRYTDVALEMLASGNLVEPALNHETAHWTKPPLTYWAIAGSVELLGRNEWGARLPSALAYAGALLVIAAFGRRLGAGSAWPVVVYASLLLPWLAANVVSTDTPLAFWELLAMYAAWRVRDGDRAILWATASGASFGAAFLTKGPPGLLPLLALAALGVLGRGSGERRAHAVVAGIAAGVAVAAPWFLVAIERHPDLLGYFLGQEVIARVATATHGRNPEWYGSVVVYGPTLLLGLLPWSPWIVGRLWSRRRELLSRSWWRDRLAADPASVLLALWVALPLVVLAISRSRLPLYVLPLAAPVALLVARHHPPPRRRLQVLLGLWLLLLVGIRGAAASYPTAIDSRAFARTLTGILDFSPSEIVFVDHRPRYGLSLYMGCEVEGIALAAPAGGPSLAQELAESEPNLRRVFVLDRDRLADAEAAAERRPEPVGELGELVLVRFPADEPRAQAPPPT